MNRNVDIICLTISRWDAPISSLSLSLSKEFAKTNRVFYIDHPFSWKDYFTERSTAPIKRRKNALLYGRDRYAKPFEELDNFVTVTSPLILPVNFLPDGWLYNRMSSLNNRKLLRLLKQMLRDHGIEEFIFINFFDPYFLGHLPSDLKPARYIYYCMDDISEVPYSRRHGARLEEDIIRRADLCYCTSLELMEMKSILSPSVFYLPNGADIGLFSSAATRKLSRPYDLPETYKKIIGFIGSIDYRSDTGLLEKAALAYPDFLFFLIGPVSIPRGDIEVLKRLPNVIFSGPRPQHEIPRYLQYIDCMIIPYKKNKLTKSIYPLKINEYLAAGKPVVSTSFSGSVELFSAVVSLTVSDSDFIERISEAICNDNDKRKRKRMEAAEDNSWKNRAARFWELAGLQ